MIFIFQFVTSDDLPAILREKIINVRPFNWTWRRHRIIAPCIYNRQHLFAVGIAAESVQQEAIRLQYPPDFRQHRYRVFYQMKDVRHQHDIVDGGETLGVANDADGEEDEACVDPREDDANWEEVGPGKVGLVTFGGNLGAGIAGGCSFMGDPEFAEAEALGDAANSLQTAAASSDGENEAALLNAASELEDASMCTGCISLAADGQAASPPSI